MKRQLYQCQQAKAIYDYKIEECRITCVAGHRLFSGSMDGTVNIRCLRRGEPLEYQACQTCESYDCNGAPIPKSERGWYNLEKTEAK